MSAAELRRAGYEPQIIELGHRLGWEWMGHGVTNSQFLRDIDEATERALIAEVKQSITAATGTTPRGWLSPGRAQTEHTPDLLRVASEAPRLVAGGRRNGKHLAQAPRRHTGLVDSFGAPLARARGVPDEHGRLPTHERRQAPQNERGRMLHGFGSLHVALL